MKYFLFLLIICINLAFTQYTAEWTSPNLGQSGWDGTDDSGSAVPSGIYFVSIIIGKNEHTKEIKFIR